MRELPGPETFTTTIPCEECCGQGEVACFGGWDYDPFDPSTVSERTYPEPCPECGGCGLVVVEPDDPLVTDCA